MQCKLTSTFGKAAKTHIIPKSFYAIDPEEKQLTKIYSTDNHPKRSPTGIWDDTIVTIEGEKIFSEMLSDKWPGAVGRHSGSLPDIPGHI